MESPENIYREQLPLIERIIDVVARRRGLAPAERTAFATYAHARLRRDKYAIIRKYDGRSQVRTFLTVVVVSLASDWSRRASRALAQRKPHGRFGGVDFWGNLDGSPDP